MNDMLKLTTKLRDLLMRWKNSEYISYSTYRSLLYSDGVLSRAYGQPKIHKKNCPFRIIVSCLNSPTYRLALYLHQIMHKSFPTAPSHVANSFQLVKRLCNILVNDDFELISLDAVSLFTNIPIDIAVDSVSNRWNFILVNCCISQHEFLLAIQLILNSTFFTFDDIIQYQQTFGTPMGSPLSPIIADIVLQDFEMWALERIKFTPSFYIRYVYDLAMAAPPSLFPLIL